MVGARRERAGSMRRAGVLVGLVALAVTAGCSGGTATPAATTAAPRPQLSEPPADPLRQGERFVRLRMAAPYTPAAPNGGTDEYRCFLVDPKVTQRVFVTGSQFLPDNAASVHHAIMFRVDPADVNTARTLDADSPGDGWTCFGGTRISGGGAGGQVRAGGAWIGAWAPGGEETLLGAKVGYLLEPGSLIVLQVHYNLLAAGGATLADQSGVRLRVVDGTAALAPLRTTLLPAPVELPCAAGETGPLCDRQVSVSDVMSRFGLQAGATVAGLTLLCNNGQIPTAGPTQHCDIRVSRTGTVYAVAGHMHLLGKSIKIELNHGTKQGQTLLDVPVYDFDDQGARVLPKPVAVKPGDTYRVTCTHDATLRAKLPELSGLPPRYVVWGDGTSDEMCLGIVIWTAV